MTLPSDFTLLQVIPELETGGAEETTIEVAEAVMRAGGKALVATRGGRMVARLVADGGRLAQMPVQSKNPLTILGNAARLTDLIRRENVSLVHARSRAPAFSALWAAKACKRPFVATYHGVYAARSPLKRWYNAVMTRGDLVIANSAYTRDHVLSEHRIDPMRVVAIPRGVDLARFDPRLVTPDRPVKLRSAWGLSKDDPRRVLLLAARMTRLKGHLTIVAAAGALRRQGRRDFLIVFAGDPRGRGEYVAELRRAIAGQGVGDAVLLAGHCSDMPAAYLAADAALLPSTHPESFGRTAVEPQAMGRPVLASAHGGVMETVAHGEAGWLVAPGDEAAWADAIAAVLDLPSERLETMGKVAAERARSLYSVETMCQATLAAYERVLEARA